MTGCLRQRGARAEKMSGDVLVVQSRIAALSQSAIRRARAARVFAWVTIRDHAGRAGSGRDVAPDVIHTDPMIADRLVGIGCGAAGVPFGTSTSPEGHQQGQQQKGHAGTLTPAPPHPGGLGGCHIIRGVSFHVSDIGFQAVGGAGHQRRSAIAKREARTGPEFTFSRTARNAHGRLASRNIH